jgi:DNA-binding IclR family transcriptional regulator
LKSADEGGVTSISDKFGIAKSTAHIHLAMLETIGYLRRNKDEFELNIK